MPDEQKSEQENAEAPQEEVGEAKGPLVHPLDPDFLLALFFAALIDTLDFVFELGTLVSLLGGGLLTWWMVKRGGQAPSSQGIQQHQAQRQAAKSAARKAIRRGILVFIAELIPLLNLLPFWVIAVLAMLRQKSEPASPAVVPSSPRDEGVAVSPA